MKTILIVEDDEGARTALETALGRDYEIRVAAEGETGIEIARAEPIDLLLCDIVLPGIDGVEVLERVKAERPRTVVIMMTAFGTVSRAVSAMKMGAYDFLEKPLDLEVLRRSVADALRPASPATRRAGRDRDRTPGVFEDMIGTGSRMQVVFDTILKVAPSRATVLVGGETGTGKEQVARAIQRHSNRADGPLVAVNCAALTSTLIESELFGHEKGAFTHALARKKGRFELADGGTLFLDEIAELPPEVQVKLLRVLQEREFERVGGTQTVKVDIRLIAATNRDLKRLVDEGTFREDLYYRIDVIRIDLPPLRERREDIPLLVAHFVGRFAEENGRPVREVSKNAMKLLEGFDWPGNIRQLENCVETAVVMATGDRISEELLPLEVRCPGEGRGQAEGVEVPVGRSLKDIEREMILRTLESVRGNKTKAAKILGIGTRTLYRKLDEYGVK